jgi:hypothetical protein
MNMRHGNRAGGSAERTAFVHFLRTGEQLDTSALSDAAEPIELKFNPYHDPRNGRFTFAPGGPRSAAAFIRSPGGRQATFGGAAAAVRKRSKGGKPRRPIRALPPELLPAEASGPGKGHNLLKLPEPPPGPALKDNAPLQKLFPGLAAAGPGVVVAATAGILANPIGPAASLLTSLNRARTEKLIKDIQAIDPEFRLASLGEPLTPQGWSNQHKQLRWARATAAYRIKGDHSFLQAETVRYVQAQVDTRYDEAKLKYDRGELPARLSREEAIGNYIDRNVRRDLRNQLINRRVSTAKGNTVRVNGREYDTSGTDTTYRIPDARVGRLAIDMTLTRKTLTTPQIRGFFNSDFLPEAVIIVRPSQLGGGSTYVITRPRS